MDETADRSNDMKKNKFLIGIVVLVFLIANVSAGDVSINYGSTYNFKTDVYVSGIYPSVSLLDTDKVIIVYSADHEDMNDVGWARIGTISNDDEIAYGTAVPFSEDPVFEDLFVDAAYEKVIKIDTTHALIVWQSDSSEIRALVATISGTTITLGADYQVYNGAGGIIDLVLIDSTHALIAIAGIGVCVCTISGSSLSFGSFYNPATNYELRIDLLDSTHFICAAKYSTTGNKAYVGTITGSTISYGTGVTYSTSSVNWNIDVTALDSSHIVVIYDKGVDHTYAKAATISGTTVTFGSEYEWVTLGNDGRFFYLCKYSSTDFIIAYEGQDEGGGFTQWGWRTDDTTLSFGGTEYEFSSYRTNVNDIALLDSDRIINVWDDDENNYGSARVGVFGEEPLQVEAPENFTNTTGGCDFWINITWDANNTQAYTDGFNVSWNNGIGSGWQNGTADYINKTVEPHGILSTVVYSYNATGIYSDPVYYNVTIQNNPISIIDCSGWSGEEGETVILDFNFTDCDNDDAVFGTNATKGELNTTTGVFTWITEIGDAGVYYFKFTVTDGYDSEDDCTVQIEVTEEPPEPTPTPTPTVGDAYIELIYPINESTITETTTYLLINVNGDEGETLIVIFYTLTGTEIGSSTVHESGEAGCVYRGLSHGNTYDWYCNVSNGTAVTMSDIWTFDCGAATASEETDEEYISPPGGGGWTSVGNTTEIMGLILLPFTTSMGDYFYAIFALATVGIVWLKTQRVFIPSMLLILLAVMMATLLPVEIYAIVYGMVALGIAGIIYVLFTRRLT